MPAARSLIALFFCTAMAMAADWPQWLGPRRDGASPEKVGAWKEAPKVLWRQPVGEGHSSPVVADNRVFVHAKVKDKDEEEVVAFDARSGEQQWRTSYARDKVTTLFGNGPRATPSVVGGKVYTFGLSGVLTCLDATSGKQVWQVDTLKKFDAKNLFFGMSCSPLVDGKRVFINVGGKGASVVAFDSDKGDVVWQSQDDKASYASPILLAGQKMPELVFLTHDGVLSLNPSDGKVQRRYSLVDKLSESSTTPVRVGDLLLVSSITLGSVGLRLDSQDTPPKYDAAWKNPQLTSYFSTPVPISNEHVYLVTGTPPPSLKVEATLHCIEAKTGKIVWKRPNVGKYHASLLRLGDGKLLLLEDHGNLALLEPSSEKYTELARAKVCGSQVWAHPALSGGKLYVRDEKELVCLQMGE